MSTSVLLASMLIVGGATAALANVNGAAFTTDNPGFDEGGDPGYVDSACANGPAHTSPGVDCNIYTDKRDVWINGGPSNGQNHLTDGSYFFAVLVPGGQPDPNDGSEKNLSSNHDDYTNRTFTVSDGHASGYTGSHNQDATSGGPLGLLIQLMPYDDTTNPGGVYILAICSLDSGYPVDPSGCKYDAFKIHVGECADASCGGGGQGDALSITKDAAGAYTNTFVWDVTKSVDNSEIHTTGDPATFNYTVTVTHDGGTISGITVTGAIDVLNPNVDSSLNVVPVVVDSVTDQLSDGTDCTVDTSGGLTLSSFHNSFPYTCSLSSLPLGQLDNTATVSWSLQALNDGDVLDGGSQNFTFPGVSFTESTVDDCVSVDDSLQGNLGTVCSGDDSPKTYTYSRNLDPDAGTCASENNTVTITGDTSGTLDTASADAKDCQGADLTVTKTANPAYTRGYNWSINKTVDEAAHIDQLSGTVTLHYHVTASETGFTDSGWTVSGTITVTNPNDWEDVTLSNVTDAVDNGGTCTVDKTGGLIVPKSGTKDFPYSCTYASKPTYNVTAHNKATATWDATAASTPSGTADTGNVDFSFTTPTSTTNKTVHVTDTYNGGSPVALGTLTAVDTTPYTTATYNLQKVVTVVPNSCVTVSNTGTITETSQTSTVTNTICGRSAVGALTMGFWQNKNGQAIITGQAKTGACPSATWLRNYAPFQDLSATATCAQVGTYVTSVIKAANASGSSMNAMLKAQMLATALDVYFSDPALGGNKIGAPTPIGGTKIDLTKICKMADKTDGTGTCSGQYSNASAAFGGATCLTVSAILTYEASQSNAGGSVWYGQVKATQELAKNTDDSINNQVAFAC